MRFCEVSPITAFLRSTQKPLTTLLKQGGKPEDAFITGLHTGDVGSGNVIKQIFQELYLGAALFKSTYGLQPAAYRGAGYILREKLLIDRSTLEEIGRGNILAVATGRPAAEAEYPLNHYKLKHLFTVIVTLDDCIEAEHRMVQKNGKAVSLSKPDPFMLDTIAESLKESVAERYYVGDMPDDMLAAAASRFGFKSIGILAAAADKSGLKRDLQKAGADYTVDDFSALKKIIL